ncbi:MAG: glucose-6-phosphate dehydrogenase [Planctomycetes bacterium]|nr:glucose-6-phosphate dehydrogenase [Planctomycetota bacterium]
MADSPSPTIAVPPPTALPAGRPAALPENPFAEGIRNRRVVEPCVIVLFGATGDLTHRKLLPALYNLARDGLLPQHVAIVGLARREKTDESFRQDLIEGLKRSSRSFSEADPLWQRFKSAIFYHPASFEESLGYRVLGERLERLDKELGTEGNRLFYLATGPEYFSPIVRLLGEAGLARPQEGPNSGAGPAAPAGPPGSRKRPWVRVVVEKPFGRDLPSAIGLNRELLAVLEESQIYRIDHYLGKETVQNILAFRFSNGIFEPLWNHKYIDHVQITVAEDLGVGSRGPYYDSSGALRDMVQNHMLQLLALVAMEPPVSMEADAVRDEKVKVLRALRPMTPEEVLRSAIRGQYAAGSILGEPVRAYRDEDRVPKDSATPTYVALRLHIDNWRWAGVPFYLRHGKRLPRRATEIAIQFHTPPMRLFGEASAPAASPNVLILNIQPDEGISLCFGSKVPGPDVRIRQVKMDFRYGHSFGVASPDAYERLLLDAIAGDSTLFTRRDEVEYAWKFVNPLLETWAAEGSRGLHFYPAGTWGPESADRLFEGAGGHWRRM